MITLKKVKKITVALLLAASMMVGVAENSTKIKAASVDVLSASGALEGGEITLKLNIELDGSPTSNPIVTVKGGTQTTVSDTNATVTGTSTTYIAEVRVAYIPGPRKGVVHVKVDYQVGGENKTYETNVTISQTIVTETPEAPEPDVPDVPSKPFGNVFSVKTGTKIPEIAAGASQDISIPLVKNGSVNNSLAQITTSLPEGLYFYEIGNVQEIKFKSGKSDENNLVLKVSANNDAKSGVYPIDMTIKYKYDGGNTEEKLTYYVKVLGNGDGGRIQVTGYSFDKQTIKSGDTFNLQVKLSNPTNSAVKNVRVGLGGLSSDGILINNALDSNYIPEIKANATTVVNFPLISATSISSNNQMLELSVTGDGMDSPLTAKIFAFVSKGEGDENSSSKPKIVIDSYDFGSESVVGGKPFNLNLAFRNTSSGVSIQNLKVTINSVSDEDTGGAFTPTSSSNSFFIKNLVPNGATVQNIELMPKADAKPKSYGLEIKFEYEANYKGELTEMSSTETISIPLAQSDRFEVGEIEMWGPFYVGMETQINLNYVNKGKSTINNLEIKIDGENMTAMESSSYVGNVESGNSDYYSVNIMANEAGPVKGKVTFSYEDANGKTVEVIKEFTNDAMAMDVGPMEPMPEPMPEEGQGLPLWGKIIIGLVVVGGVGAVGFVLYRKKKTSTKKKQEELESYDDFPEDGE